MMMTGPAFQSKADMNESRAAVGTFRNYCEFRATFPNPSFVFRSPPPNFSVSGFDFEPLPFVLRLSLDVWHEYGSLTVRNMKENKQKPTKE
jgi:hypothetical protein